MKPLAFNTGRLYTAAGQRIAATAIDGGVYFVDVDRGIRGFLPGTALNYTAIMARYDSNQRMGYMPPSFDANSPDKASTNLNELATAYRIFHDSLTALAEAVPPAP